ncbi:MAG TPA: AAA family ATPase, partial [Candidatus Acidoferrum sp.]|nr:AAA family ATPase [Candidatus Acidoferrum sp.]
MGREERKVVTVLFTDLVGFTSRAEELDPEDVRALLSPYYARLREQIERRGGTVEKFIGDAVMAVFGAPVAHEDDPVRAVLTALAIRDSSPDLEIRTAVNTGEALVALDADVTAGEALVSGDVVNTAARLQGAAPVNGILVGEATYRATRHVIDYRDAAAVEAKGKARHVPVWEVVAARPRYGIDVEQVHRSPLVGRERELFLLTDAFARCRSEERAQFVTLVGVPGIGKSRLVAELFTTLDNDPDVYWWRQGRSLPYGESRSVWALGEIVKAQAGILESDDAQTAREKLAATCSDEWVLSYLWALAGVGGEIDESRDRRVEAFSAWRRFFELLADERPLVLVFEDLQWADDTLLDFVDYLAEWVAGVPMLILATARPELLDRRPGWGGGKRNATTISLAALPDEATARLLPMMAAEKQQLVLARAEGNPLYAAEFA